MELGDRVRCKASGFTGIAISRTTYLNGCVQFGVRPSVDKDGKLPDSWSIDEETLEVLAKDAVGVKPKAVRTGGPSVKMPR